MYIKFEHGQHYLSDSPHGPWTERVLMESRQRKDLYSPNVLHDASSAGNIRTNSSSFGVQGIVPGTSVAR
jgi:hypothetical protein